MTLVVRRQAILRVYFRWQLLTVIAACGFAYGLFGSWRLIGPHPFWILAMPYVAGIEGFGLLFYRWYIALGAALFASACAILAHVSWPRTANQIILAAVLMFIIAAIAGIAINGAGFMPVI